MQPLTLVFFVTAEKVKYNSQCFVVADFIDYKDDGRSGDVYIFNKLQFVVKVSGFNRENEGLFRRFTSIVA